MNITNMLLYAVYLILNKISLIANNTKWIVLNVILSVKLPEDATSNTNKASKMKKNVFIV